MSIQPSIDPTTGRPAKRPASVYTVMLAVTVLALMVSCLLLLMEWRSYQYEIKAKLTYNFQAPSAGATLASNPAAGRLLNAPVFSVIG